MKMSKNHCILLAVSGLVGLCIFFLYFYESEGDFFSLESFIKSYRPQTGDILLWADVSINSLAVQSMTDGSYSHCGLIHQEDNGTMWLLDVYPGEALRYRSLEEILKTHKNIFTRVALMRSKHFLDKSVISKYIQEVLSFRNRFMFDQDMILDFRDLSRMRESSSVIFVYCTELVSALYQASGFTLDCFGNDYQRVIDKWTASRDHPKSVISFFQRFYMTQYLRKLQHDPDKILLSPNGILRSKAFSLVCEIKGHAQPKAMKRVLTRLPGVMSN